MDLTFGDVQNVIGKPLSGKGRITVIAILLFIVVVLIIAFLLATGYIKLSNPAAPTNTNTNNA